MSADVQRWTYDADAGLCRRLDSGNYEFLPHGVVVVLADDHEAAVQAARDEVWNAAIDAAALAGEL